MQPFFTLILPCYKVAAYVERCVQSILAQDFTDYQIILVDDGSPDDTPAICDRLAAEHACISVLHKENGGLASARNAGMDAAQGQYIWFVDSDDWIEPGALALLHRACQDGNPEMVKFSHYRVTKQSVWVSHHVDAGKYAGAQPCDLLRRKAFCEAGKYSLSACFHVYRRSFLEACQVRFVSERVVGSEDYLFNLQLLLYANHVQVLTEPLYSYEARVGSLTHQYKPDLADRYAEMHRQLTVYMVNAGLFDSWKGLLERFFLWHLIVGTCFTHEYAVFAQVDTMRAARRHVKRLLRRKDVQRAVWLADRKGLRWQKIIQLMGMKLRMEWMFYCLYGKRAAAQ